MTLPSARPDIAGIIPGQPPITVISGTIDSEGELVLVTDPVALAARL